jgi:putative PIN family toxin of toxin-antitoxin system
VKVVFDSNIFISAFVVPRGQAEKAILKVIEENVTLILSKEIIGEVLRVLSAKFKRDKEALSRTAVYLSDLATIVKSSRKLKILKDEPDNRILECAVAGGADLIVTGDKALLRLKEFEGIQILSLKEFLELGSS